MFYTREHCKTCYHAWFKQSYLEKNTKQPGDIIVTCKIIEYENIIKKQLFLKDTRIHFFIIEKTTIWVPVTGCSSTIQKPEAKPLLLNSVQQTSKIWTISTWWWVRSSHQLGVVLPRELKRVIHWWNGILKYYVFLNSEQQASKKRRVIWIFGENLNYYINNKLKMALIAETAKVYCYVLFSIRVWCNIYI